MKDTREPSTQRFWSILDLRLRLFAEADKSALAVLACTNRDVFEGTIPFLYADIPSKHAMKVLACPVIGRRNAYRRAVKVVRFEENEWLSEKFARQLAGDPDYNNMDRDLILYGNWSKRAEARDAEDVDDDARSAASDQTFGLPGSFTFSSVDLNTEFVLSSLQLSHQLRFRFPLLREIDLSDITVLSPLGSAPHMKDCIIKLSELHPSDNEAALVSLEIGVTEADSELHSAAQVPVPTGTIGYQTRIALPAYGCRDRYEIELGQPGTIVHIPRVALHLAVDDEDVFGPDGFALLAEYGRLASLFWYTFSDRTTLLNYVDDLEILVTGVQYTVTELEQIIAHFTGRGAVGTSAARSVRTISVDDADRPPLRSLELDSEVTGPLPLYQLLRSPLLESLDMLELCTTQTSGPPEHFHAPLHTWMDNVTRYMPKLRVLRLGGVIAHDADTVIPDHQELGDGPSLGEVELHVTGDISQGTTRNGDINRAHAVSRWMKSENPVVRIALADQDSEMDPRDYTATLERLSRWAARTSTRLDGIDLRELGMISPESVERITSV